MIFLPLILLFVGAAIGLAIHVGPLHGITGTYLAVACLAGLDTVCGGIRSGLEGKFSADVFLTGFISNVIIASFVAWLGDMIGIDLYVAVALVFAKRILDNLSLIRRFALTTYKDARERRRLKALVQPQSEGGQ